MNPSKCFPQLPGRLLFWIALTLLFIPTVSFAKANGDNSANIRGSLRLVLNPTSLNLRDFGALGDGVSDDGPALQAALDALAAAGGGTLYVPPGKYAVVTPVVKDFSGLASSITIQGEPSDVVIDVRGNGTGLGLVSELIIKVGEDQNALWLRGLNDLLIRDLTFLGVQGVNNDALQVLRVDDVDNATVQHCEFYGLASLRAGGAILLAVRSGLRVTDTAFLGCATNSGVSTSMVQNIQWKGIAVVNTKFVDYGNLPEFYSKTPLAAAYSWISIGNAAALEATSSRREAIIENVFLDEGAFIQLSARPNFFGQSALFEVFISRLRMNVNNLRASGLYFDGVPRAIVERSFFGWSHNATAAIDIIRSGNIVLDQVECVAHANTIRADSSVQLTVINSVYDFLVSNPETTTVLVTADPMDDPVQFVRQQYLDTLSHEPDPAAYHYWTNLLLGCTNDCNEVRQALSSYLLGQPAPKFELSGLVTNELGVTIPGALVELSGSQAAVTMSDAGGSYSFSQLATAGSYRIVAAKTNYDFQTYSLVEVSGDQNVNLVGMQHRYVVSGQVRTEAGQPIRGASVALSGDGEDEVITDSEGRYSFPGLPGGKNYTLTVARVNYQFPAPTVTLANLSADVSHSFTGLLNHYAVRGKVSLPEGGGHSGVSVAVSGTVTRSSETDAQGGYDFSLPAEGDYTITPLKSGFAFSPYNHVINNLSSPLVVAFTSSLPAKVRFSESNYFVAENDLLVQLTIIRSENTSSTLHVTYKTVDGSAQQDSDYTFASGVLTFGPSETTKTIEVLITDNAYSEPDESLSLSVRDYSGNILTEAIVTILANDPTPPQNNPIDEPDTFVVQQYADFLGRAPDQGGLDYWRARITDCGDDELCIRSRRVGVSAAFFVESEFQETGGYLYRLKHSITGALPTYAEFMQNRGYLTSYSDLTQGKEVIAGSLAANSEFLTAFPSAMEKSEFIQSLLSRVQQTTGVDLESQRLALVEDYVANDDRARILRLIADDPLVQQGEYNRAFVLMQYFGYLRRDPDLPGYEFWLNVLNNREPGNFRGMVCAFLTSKEFQERFSPIAPRNDQECASVVR